MRTRTMAEYEKYKKEFGKKALDALHAKSDNFYIEDFIKLFKEIEQLEDIRVELAWPFLYWRDRVTRYLYSQVKAGVLVGGRGGLYAFTSKPVLNNYLQAQVEKLTPSPIYGYGVKIVSKEDLTETNFMQTDLGGLLEILHILNKNKEWKENA